MNRAIFTGETLSIAGCALECTAEQMVLNMDKILSMPEDTKIFCS